MTGIILDAVLMLLLVAAIGYGIRLERKLTQLRAGQLAFAGAVTELNTAAGRAESALASLRMSGEEADMLHDRIIKARALKTELEGLIARAPSKNPSVLVQEHQSTSPSLRDREETRISSQLRSNGVEDDRIAIRRPDREAVEGLLPQTRPAQPPTPKPTLVLQALAANQAAQQSLNRARRSMDEDLFAA